MPENLSPANTASSDIVPTSPGELKSNTGGRAGKAPLSCPKCGKVYHKQAGIRARERHEVDCKGEAEGPLFQDNPKQREKEVKRPPKKQLWYCTNILEGGAPCNASFYEGTETCPNCGAEIEW